MDDSARPDSELGAGIDEIAGAIESIPVGPLGSSSESESGSFFGGIELGGSSGSGGGSGDSSAGSGKRGRPRGAGTRTNGNNRSTPDSGNAGTKDSEVPRSRLVTTSKPVKTKPDEYDAQDIGQTLAIVLGLLAFWRKNDAFAIDSNTCAQLVGDPFVKFAAKTLSKKVNQNIAAVLAPFNILSGLYLILQPGLTVENERQQHLKQNRRQPVKPEPVATTVYLSSSVDDGNRSNVSAEPERGTAATIGFPISLDPGGPIDDATDLRQGIG